MTWYFHLNGIDWEIFEIALAIVAALAVIIGGWHEWRRDARMARESNDAQVAVLNLVHELDSMRQALEMQLSAIGTGLAAVSERLDKLEGEDDEDPDSSAPSPE